MIPVFGQERRRKINLGGVSSTASQGLILDQVRIEREERLKQRAKNDSAVRIQAWWRGTRQTKATRQRLRELLMEDALGFQGLRCLALLARYDEEVLAAWSERVAASGPDVLFALARGPQYHSWLVLIKSVAFSLLSSVAHKPMGAGAVSHLKVLNLLLSPQIQGFADPAPPVLITEYLLDRRLYSMLSQAIRTIPVECRSSPSLPLLISLCTLPFETLSTLSPQFTSAFTSLFSEIFTIPLLPNRLSAQSLGHLSAHIPFTQIPLLNPVAMATSIELESKSHLIANLQVFVAPRYKFIQNALPAYLILLSVLFNAIPSSMLKPEESKSSSATSWDSDSDSEDAIHVSVVSSFSAPQPALPKLDSREIKRISALASRQHLSSLFSIYPSPKRPLLPLISFVFALSCVWPSVLDDVLAQRNTAGLVREIYRSYVRSAPLGKTKDDTEYTSSLFDPQNAPVWPPLLLLTDLYSQALLTMGDDEFFGTSAPSSTSHILGSSSASSILPTAANTSASARNPFSLDELNSFSKQLLNIAFPLYWREDQAADVMQTTVGAGTEWATRCTWIGVREKITKCLVGIHARDSRKPFLPPDHWLMTSQIDVQLFVEAAIFEERQLSASEEPPASRVRSSAPNHSKLQLALLSPRLGVLNNIPFAIPFDVRVSIFRHFVMNDMVSRASNAAQATPVNSRVFLSSRAAWSGFGEKTRVHVRRGHVAEDGFDKLAEADLKTPIEITFIDQFGGEEAGIDGGGVFKEFFTSLCKEVFDTDRGLWLANKKNELYPNPHAYATEAHSLNWYRFIGRILGKAMYEGILVDVAFAGFFLAKWLGKQSFLDDLASLDPDLYNGLIFLKHYDGNFEDLALNFTVATEEFGVTKAVDLIPDGSNTPVTPENRLMYIYLVSHYRLSRQIKLQSEAFFQGLSEMIDPKWIRMFNQQEIQILIGGVNKPIDFEDLRQNTQYGGLYDDDEPTIQAFWRVVGTFNHEQRMALLRFATSCSRPPLLGFKELVPNFSIRDAGTDQNRLPTASTCVNLLKLPRYTDERVLKTKLLQAITSNAGFDLS